MLGVQTYKVPHLIIIEFSLYLDDSEVRYHSLLALLLSLLLSFIHLLAPYTLHFSWTIFTYIQSRLCHVFRDTRNVPSITFKIRFFSGVLNIMIQLVVYSQAAGLVGSPRLNR